jgi:hypothetical protein
VQGVHQVVNLFDRDGIVVADAHTETKGCEYAITQAVAAHGR